MLKLILLLQHGITSSPFYIRAVLESMYYNSRGIYPQ